MAYALASEITRFCSSGSGGAIKTGVGLAAPTGLAAGNSLVASMRSRSTSTVIGPTPIAMKSSNCRGDSLLVSLVFFRYVATVLSGWWSSTDDFRNPRNCSTDSRVCAANPTAIKKTSNRIIIFDVSSRPSVAKSLRQAFRQSPPAPAAPSPGSPLNWDAGRHRPARPSRIRRNQPWRRSSSDR